MMQDVLRDLKRHLLADATLSHTKDFYLKIGTYWLNAIIQQIYVLRYYKSASGWLAGWLAVLGETNLLEILFLAKFSQLSKKL